MSKLPKTAEALVYFDKHSPIGHPSPDKWIPLEMKEGKRTDVAHTCPKRNNGSALDSTSTAVATTTTAAIITKPESLQFAETLSQILQDYIRPKKQEIAAK